MNAVDTINYIDPASGLSLNRDKEGWVHPETGQIIAPIVDGVPRFVSLKENYATNFGWQWNHWKDNQSESRGASVKQYDMLIKRTHFDEYEIEGKTILECGMGGGDDTEVLLQLPFGRIHSFDLSNAVDRAAAMNTDPRLTLTQASIYDIPYPDESFDFVFCHRVLQHTPDPAQSLRCIAKKVKKGGILFAHAYRNSVDYMREWRYKYRPLSTKLPDAFSYFYVRLLGTPLHYLIEALRNGGPEWEDFAYEYIPFYYLERKGSYKIPVKEAIELEKLITFDALTPVYDLPMTSEEFTSIIAEEGFEIEHLEDGLPSPVYATARKRA